MAVSSSTVESTRNAVAASLTGGRRDWKGMGFALLLVLCMVASLLMLTVLLRDVIAQALPVFEKRSTGFQIGRAHV